jgi:hypothetical protein
MASLLETPLNMNPEFNPQPATGATMRTLLVLGGLLLGLLSGGCGKSASPKDEITLEELNRAIRMTAMSPAGTVKQVSELTNFPAFKGRRLPTPPPGKKFVINPATREIAIVDQ